METGKFTVLNGATNKKTKIDSKLTWKKTLEKLKLFTGADVNSLKYIDEDGDEIIVHEEDEWDDLKRDGKVTSFFLNIPSNSFSVSKETSKTFKDTKDEIIKEKETVKEGKNGYNLFDMKDQGVYNVYKKIFVHQDEFKMRVIQNDNLFRDFKSKLKKRPFTLYYSPSKDTDLNEIYQNGVIGDCYSSPTNMTNRVIVCLANIEENKSHKYQLSKGDVYPIYEVEFSS